jgi:hypothetical protein
MYLERVDSCCILLESCEFLMKDYHKTQGMSRKSVASYKLQVGRLQVKNIEPLGHEGHEGRA